MRVKFNYLTIALFLLFSFALVAQEGWEVEFAQEVTEVNVARDSQSTIDQRRLDDNLLKEYTLDRDYQYTSGPNSTETLWDRIKRQLYENLIRPLFDAGAQGAGEVLILLLAIGGVALMFFFFFKNRKASVLDKKDLTWGEVFTNPAEIEEQQFNKWMQDAESKSDYNEALKYLYLRCIRQIDKKNLLHYRPEYTNRQVINKLKNKDVKEVFTEVARQFEFVWYGHFDLDEQTYGRLKLLVNESVIGS